MQTIVYVIGHFGASSAQWWRRTLSSGRRCAAGVVSADRWSDDTAVVLVRPSTGVRYSSVCLRWLIIKSDGVL